MSATQLHVEANLISRLDRMPMNKAVMLLVGLLSWCWVMEAFDIGMIGQVVLVLKNIWKLDAGTVGLLRSCSTAGVVIGTACAGFLTDRFGRKRVLLWGVFIFTFFTLVGSAIANLGWIVSMRFIAGLITWYVVMVYVPTILTSYGFALSNSVILAGAMTVLGGVGSVVMGPLADKYGRKPIWSIYVIITIISLFLLTSTESIAMLLFIGAFVAFFGTGIMPICKVYVAEQYPTELRGVGTGFGEAVSRVVGGVLSTYYLAFFLAMGGVKAVFIFMAVAFGIAIVALWIWGQETARRSVEDTASSKKT